MAFGESWILLHPPPDPLKPPAWLKMVRKKEQNMNWLPWHFTDAKCRCCVVGKPDVIFPQVDPVGEGGEVDDKAENNNPFDERHCSYSNTFTDVPGTVDRLPVRAI